MGKIYSHFKKKFHSSEEDSSISKKSKNEVQSGAPSNSESELKKDQEDAVMAITSKSLTMVNAKMGVYDGDDDE